MMNFVTLVGRITQDPEVKELENSKVSNICVAVPRSFKNENGEYEADFIDVTLWNEIATNVKEYCHKGDLVGVKGRLQVSTYETENGDKRKSVKVIAEKISFLSSKPKDEE